MAGLVATGCASGGSTSQESTNGRIIACQHSVCINEEQSPGVPAAASGASAAAPPSGQIHDVTTPAPVIKTAIIKSPVTFGPTPAPAPATAAAGHCPDSLSAPTDPPSSSFEISLVVICPVQSGNSLLLTAEIANADGHGHTEYYFAGWKIRTDTRMVQTYQAHVTSGIQRTYFVISVTSEQLGEIDSTGNTFGDGGHTSLFDAVIVSNTQPNKTP